MSSETRVRSFITATHNQGTLSESAHELLSKEHKAVPEKPPRDRLIGDFFVDLNVQAIRQDNREVKVVLADAVVGFLNEEEVNDGDETYKVYTASVSATPNRRIFRELGDAVAYLIYAEIKRIAR